MRHGWPTFEYSESLDGDQFRRICVGYFFKWYHSFVVSSWSNLWMLRRSCMPLKVFWTREPRTLLTLNFWSGLDDVTSTKIKIQMTTLLLWVHFIVPEDLRTRGSFRDFSRTYWGFFEYMRTYWGMLNIIEDLSGRRPVKDILNTYWGLLRIYWGPIEDLLSTWERFECVHGAAYVRLCSCCGVRAIVFMLRTCACVQIVYVRLCSCCVGLLQLQFIVKG